MSWHVTADLWRGYTAGRLDPALEDSIDAHVQRCRTCQIAANAHASTLPLGQVWSGVAARVTDPAPTGSRRVIGALGINEADAVVLASSTLALPWAISVATALASAVLAGIFPDQKDATFLLLAPLIPVLAVVAAFHATDPLRELVAVTPASKFRLALLRASGALVVAVPVTTGVGLLVPPLTPLAFTWLLPALALTAGTLALLTWLTAWPSAAVVSSIWLVVVAGLMRADRVQALWSATAAAIFIAALVVLTGVFVARSTTARLQGGY